MTDDIVTRLREELAHRLRWHVRRGGYECMCETCVFLMEAADEIERLRAEVDKWKKVSRERNPKSWSNLVRKRWGMEDMYER